MFARVVGRARSCGGAASPPLAVRPRGRVDGVDGGFTRRVLRPVGRRGLRLSELRQALPSSNGRAKPAELPFCAVLATLNSPVVILIALQRATAATTAAAPAKNKKELARQHSHIHASAATMDPFGRPDPNGAEALPGEYQRVHSAPRKTQDRARARMRAKFGSGGLGGVGSDGSYRSGTTMQGVGSNSDYDPSTGKYRGQKTGIQSLREGEFTSDNVKDAALEAASKLKKKVRREARRGRHRARPVQNRKIDRGWTHARGPGRRVLRADGRVAEARASDDPQGRLTASPAITDLRTLTRFMGDRRKAADIFDDIRKALKPTPAYRALQRALACVRHLVVNGPEHVVDRAWHLRREIQDLEGYDSTKGYLGTRNDEGRFVREKAKELATLLDDFDQIRELRADAARNTYEGDQASVQRGRVRAIRLLLGWWWLRAVAGTRTTPTCGSRARYPRSRSRRRPSPIS